jgi:prepilin-type N-terminal cleavage/methylation domain-containing protein
MNKNAHYPARRGFTLVEVLAVIAIICLLVAMLLTIVPGVIVARSTARTKADVSALGNALEAFKLYYGEYPPGEGENASDQEKWQHVLYDCVTGQKVLHVQNGDLELADYRKLPAGSTRLAPARKPFLTDANISLGLDVTGQIPKDERDRYFVDAWGNAYAYRYNSIVAGKLGLAWKRPGFLLISPGPKFKEKDKETDYFSEDYFIGNMETDGRIPNDYFSGDRADNITNW